MSQKNDNMRIVKELLKKENHIRGLARDINSNQTTVSRKIGELYNANIVDYKIEGKNKVYFLKKTLEARQYALIVEMYKLLEAVKKYPRLRRILEEIKKQKSVHFAIIFGSYASGKASQHSDIDIYIESADKNVIDLIKSTDSKLSIQAGKLDPTSTIAKEIQKNHTIIKGFEEYYDRIRPIG